MTRELLSKLPKNILESVNDLRKAYKSKNYYEYKQILSQIGVYAKALRDCGFITERERQILVVYMTV